MADVVLCVDTLRQHPPLHRQIRPRERPPLRVRKYQRRIVSTLDPSRIRTTDRIELFHKTDVTVHWLARSSRSSQLHYRSSGGTNDKALLPLPAHAHGSSTITVSQMGGRSRELSASVSQPVIRHRRSLVAKTCLHRPGSRGRFRWRRWRAVANMRRSPSSLFTRIWWHWNS
ncbi:hypothetical protein DFH09DRAFT_1125809 [Mycena vulgaris]|nr:hypothetical protein DFH09DRAFT_1125809 [Mycena vulgaris]